MITLKKCQCYFQCMVFMYRFTTFFVQPFVLLVMIKYVISVCAYSGGKLIRFVRGQNSIELNVKKCKDKQYKVSHCWQTGMFCSCSEFHFQATFYVVWEGRKSHYGFQLSDPWVERDVSEWGINVQWTDV